MSTGRPATSKSRGICRYYSTPRGCLAGNSCKFLHGEQEGLTPYDKSKTCRYFAAGYCKRGADCWFRHVRPVESALSADTGAIAEGTSSVVAESDEEDLCSICYEKPVTFGLLDGCSHMFCISCIKGWRDGCNKGEDLVSSGNTKRCPTCRAESKFVTPSSIFYPSGHPSKALVTEQYKASMKRVSCRYFQDSPPHNRFCPFGKDCFYRHLNEDGTEYEFNEGVDYYMRRRRRYERRQRLEPEPGHTLPFLEEMQATMESIRASLQVDFGDGDLDDVRDFAAAFEEIDNAGSLLRRLAEDVALLLPAEDRSAGRIRAYRLLPTRWPVFPRAASETRDVQETREEAPSSASNDPPQPSLSESAGSLGISDGTSSGAPILPPIEEVSDVSPTSAESVSSIDSTETDMTDDVLIHTAHEVCPPPFLTDGRGRVVWSNTTASK